MTTGVGYVGVKESSEPANMWMMDAPSGDFTATVKVTGILTHSYNSCLVGVYADGASVIQMSRRFHPTLGEKAGSPASKMGTVGNIFDFYTYTTKYVEKYTADTNFDSSAWLRITREGDTFRGFYSYDGENFTEMPGTLTNDSVSAAESLQIVVACQMGANSTFKNEIVFEDLEINGEKIPFTSPNEVGVSDINLIDCLHALRDSVNASYTSAADIDRDGSLTLLDIIKMLKLIAE